jgi:acyl carrier protein
MTGYDTLKKIFVEDLKVPADLVAPDATLKDIEFDSLALVELTVILERDLGVDIHEDELKDLGTLGDMARLVDERVAQARA